MLMHAEFISPAHFAQQLVSPAVDADIHLSGSRFFFTVLAGLVLAFAFQMLLTNFSVALGISVLDTGLATGNSTQSGDADDGSPPIRTIGIAMGVWTLISVSLALFGACALALKFSLIATPLQAISLALVIWATYFTLLVWISTTTVGSLIGSVVNTATSSFQTIFGTAAAAIGAKTAKSELISTLEDATAAVRRQVTADIDGEDLMDSLRDYLVGVRSPSLNLTELREEFKQILQDPSVSNLEPEHLQQINREAFDTLVRDRTDMSKRERQAIVDQMERAWSEAMHGYQKRDRMSDLITFVRESTPQTLLSDDLAQQLEKLVQDYRQQQQSNDNSGFFGRGFNFLIATLASRVDLSDFEISKATSQIKQAKDQLLDQVDQAYLLVDPNSEPPTALETDVEAYLLNTQPWEFTPERIERKFRSILLDPQSNPATMRRQINGLSRMDFREILESRGLFTQAKIEKIQDHLRLLCRTVATDLSSIIETQKREALSKKTFIYLQTTPKDQLSTKQIHRAFGELVDDSEVDADQLRRRFGVLNRTELMKPLQARPDLDPEEINRILDDLQWVQDRAIADAESLKASAEIRVQQQWQRLQDYLRQTGKPELNPQGIKRDLETLLDDPEAGFHDLQLRLSHFDRDTLVQLLSQRPEFNEPEIQKILNQVEQNWSTTKHAPAILKAKAELKYQEATTAIADYLRNTGKSELNPDGIRRDLKLLLNDPQAGYEAIYDRLSRMDRDTLVQLLSQRDDMRPEDVNRIINQVQSTLNQIVGAPRRLAQRTQSQIESFQSSLADYLRSTEKSELNPDGIKRDLNALLVDPRWGMERLGDRLSQVDDSTLVALLAQRDDMTEAEAQDVVDQIIAVRTEIQSQFLALSDRVKSVLDSIFDRIRGYLNGLERPELNYDGIRHDVRVLLDDPEAGFDALRDRLAHFDRGTLVAVMSSHDAISERDAEQLIHQIETTRASVLQRAERAQMRFQERIERLQAQAAERIEMTKKAAAIAAWWLFATAVVSGAAAAFGATLAI